MSLTTVNVSIAVFAITGAALPRGRVRLELSAADVAASGLVAPAGINVHLDADGEGVAALWANVNGTQGTQYTVAIYSASGALQFSGVATVPANDCNLHEILSLQPPAVVDDAQAAVLAAQAYAAAAGAAGATAGAAAGSEAAAAALALKTDKTESLMAWALVQAFQVVSATRNTDGAVTTASIVWPDGATGTFTADTLNTTFTGAIDAWHATYAPAAGSPKTVTQPLVTRDSDGAVTAQPAITIA